jgi:1-aminocyclopropane-1-carboxylate deaminase/D-cysteine desulfhydrase-like pyridoxal-dependent ACC family enzyme
MNPNELRALVDRLPRARLLQYPTPLDEVPRFARALAGERAPRIFLKRDDLTPITGGGNKARVLEFFVGEALELGADVLVAGGGVAQSNHARACGAVARKFGMKPVMVLRGGGHHAEGTPQGNLLLDKLLDVELRFVSPEQLADGGRFGLSGFMDEAAEEYRRRGHRPYVIKSSPFPPGPVGYVAATMELQEQLGQLGVDGPLRIYGPSTGGTQAGLMLGAEALGLPWRVIGASPSPVTEDAAREQVARVAGWTAERLGLATRISPAAVEHLGGRYAGDAYGAPTEQSLEALRLLALTEGTIVDPVYNAKALAALVDQVRSGAIGRDETVVYVNTGGFPGLFAYAEELSAYYDGASAISFRGA